MMESLRFFIIFFIELAEEIGQIREYVYMLYTNVCVLVGSKTQELPHNFKI